MEKKRGTQKKIRVDFLYELQCFCLGADYAYLVAESAYLVAACAYLVASMLV